jgi:16S rRNA (cytidine1402-2'-O)-methyltransferase
LAATLYLVATPIGNLEDITLRALRILREEVAIIACEDTRHTQKLFDHYQIRKPLLSYHEHNELARKAEIVEALERGDAVALVSDAGTPLISDPGYRIVKAAVEKGIPVVSLPGPSAILSALAASGLPTHEFRFVGFFPSKAIGRHKALEELAEERATIVAYESPHRILSTLSDMAEIFGDRPVVLARELTKVHEEFLRGSAQSILNELSQRTSVKGEITLVVGGAVEQQSAIEDPSQEVQRLQTERGLDRMEAIKNVAKRMGLPKREVYRLAAERSNNPPGRHRD